MSDWVKQLPLGACTHPMRNPISAWFWTADQRPFDCVGHGFSSL